jgi:superfamily II DNA or RNA helicase
MDKHIQINGTYNLVICLKCERALTPGDGAISHLRGMHQVSGTDLKDIEDYLALGQANNPKTIELPTNGGPQQPVIPVVKGFKCRACPYITTSEKLANIHWRTAEHTLEGCRYTKVRVQSWMSGKYARYWTVGNEGYDPTTDIDARDEAGNERSLSVLEQLVRRGAKRLRESNAQWHRAGQAQQGADYDNEFVKDMRWIKFTEEKDRAVIAAATRWVKAKAMDGTIQEALEGDTGLTAQLTMLCDSIKREVERCEPRIYAVPKPILQRLHGIEGGKSNPIPFRMSEDTDTLQKYSIVCQRYLCLCWRAYKLGREEAEAKLGMRFTDEQWSLLCDMDRVLQETDRNGLDGGERSDGYDSDTGGFIRSSQPETRRPGGHAELDGVLFKFIIASIKTKVGGAMYTNALLCFFAATAIREGGNGFLPAGVFTATVAAMLWILRLFFLEDSFQDMPLNVEDISVEKMEWFTEQHAQWLSVDRFTVVGTMISWMAYGKGHRNKTMATPSVRWTDDYETLIHNGEHIRIHEFQRAAYRLKLRIDHLMGRLLGDRWSTIGPNIDLEGIRDDMTYLGAGQSFATNKANEWLRSGPELAIKAAQSMLFDSRANTWKRKGVTKWLGDLRQLKGLLMPGCHVWPGMPGRGPEVSTMRHCDGLQVMRNVFLYSGSVMIVTDRDKTKSIRDMGRKVARFLPDDMGRVLVAYIAWLLPAEEFLEQELMLPATPPSIKEFMWRHGPSGRWKTEKLSSLLAREIGTGLGVRMGTARYRMIVIEMGRIVDGLVLEEWEKKIEDDNHDGIELDELSGEVLHIGGSWNIIWDLQSTHGTRTARQSYAVHIGMPGHLHPMLVRRYHEVSRLWHLFLEKGNPLKSWGNRARGDQHESNKKADMENIEAETLAALQELEGSTATWRSAKQEECMHAIMRLEDARHLICVLPTGAGKSNLFMVPAMMRGRGTTVVVVPFSRLLDDMVGRMKQKGVDVVHFQRSQIIAREALPYVPRLVIVSADVAVAEDELFMAYMDKLKAGNHLQRIFIDEAHVAITDSAYREQLTKLKWLHRFSEPIIMLTATLMKTMERDFREMLVLQTETPIIRDRTTKKNARYEFVQVGRKEGAVEKATVQFVRRTQSSMMSQEKCIVYCKSIDDCREIAETLACVCHHSQMSDAHCREVVARWSSGQGSAVMAATTGLGTGLDFLGIIAIFFMGIPFGLYDYIQQTGRGARRAGEFVLCRVIHDGVKPFEARGISSFALKSQHAMWTVATAPGCVREQIAMIMDGVFGECCVDVPDAVPCYRCEPSYAFPSKHTESETAPVAGDDNLFAEINATEMGTHALVQRIDAEDTRARGFPANASTFQEDYRQRATDELVVKRWLIEVESKCAACFTKRLLLADNAGRETGQTGGEGAEKEAEGDEGEEEDHEALGTSCPARVEGMESYRKRRKQLRFAGLSCCFTCKLPLDWCLEAKEDRGTPNRCVYVDKVLPAIEVASSITREAQWIRDSFHIDPTDKQAFRQWLAGKRVFMDKKGTNMHMLWAMVVRKTYGHRMRAIPSATELV